MPHRVLSKLFRCLLLCGLVLLCGCSKEPLPDRGFLDDRAELLSDVQRQRITEYHQRLLGDLDIHLQVIILDQPASDIDQQAVSLFEDYRLGADTGAARGVLLLVDPQGHQVRLEIGYDLESVFTDLLVGRVEREQMVPFFQAARVGEGLEATVELLVAEALTVSAENVPAGQPLPRLSGGAGAKTQVEIGSGAPLKSAIDDARRFAPGESPRATLARYAEALRAQVKDPDLPLYTPATREFFHLWLVTDAQQASEFKSVTAALANGETILGEQHAVVRCPPGMRTTPPYLLHASAQGWQLDFAAMSRVIGFNHLNQWFFRNRQHAYMFAFEDWTFDAHGFPNASGR
jgi:hypothetical protein